MEVTSELRDLISRHGLIAVHEAVEKEMRETYEYLEKLYGNSEKYVKKSEEPVKNSEEPVKKILGIGEKSKEDQEKILEPGENSVELIQGNLGIGEKPGEIVEEKSEKAWPFIKSEKETEEKQTTGARKLLKEEISNRKKEINSSGLKRNEVMTKENLEKLISEGLGYTEMGRRLGRMPHTVKMHCDKYKLEIMRNVRKTIPESLKKYLDDEESKKQLILENKKQVEKLLSTKDNEWIHTTKLCIYGVFKKNNLECVYIGSTEDFGKRVSMHKKGYEEGDERKLYTLMKENGGFDNHIYIPLEKPENEIGLSVRESLWWETMKPLGNSVNPYFTT